MKITLTDAGKRFNRDWVFRHVSYEFTTGHSYAITGPNGSGKSTLLQVISGSMVASEGNTKYEIQNTNGEIPNEQVYRHISMATPYMEVIEEMSLPELLQFHSIFKPFLPTVDINKIITVMGLENAAHKQIRYYSSGMKQRVKLAQAIFSDTPAVLLDEPCTNLDAAGIALYQQLIREYCQERLMIISSNDKQEYGFCEQVININDHKN